MPRLATLTSLWLCSLVFVSISTFTNAATLASVTATRPKPIVLTTVKPPSPESKPKTSKPDGGSDAPDLSGGGGTSPSTSGGSTTTNANGYVFMPCTNLELSLVMNPSNYDVQQCMAFSTYNFGSGFIPTPLQKSLLCDTGCWDLIDRLLVTPIPYCSVLLGGRAVNYIDALYTVFSNCAAPQAQEQPVESPTEAPTAAVSSGSDSWRTGMLSLTLSLLALAAML